MSKINIPTIRGGFNLSKINDAFQTIEDHLNDKVLYRDTPGNEPNQMKNDLDMNGERIYNLPEPMSENEPARLIDLANKDLGVYYNKIVRVEDEQIRSLPDKQERANKLLTFDSEGQPTVEYPATDSATQLRIDLTQPTGDDPVGGFDSYAKVRAYTGTATRMKVKDLSGTYWWVRRDSAGDNGGTVLKDAQDRSWEREYSGNVDPRWFGVAFDGTDESSAALACLRATGSLWVPKGKRLICKNIELLANDAVKIDGSVSLPDICIDFDRCFYAYDKPSIEITINEIDGNYSGQYSNIGTHLIYLVRCHDAKVHIKHAHDHYIASGAPMPDVVGDGRNASTGAIWLYRCHNADVNIGLLSGWGREGVYLEECTNSDTVLGHAQGVYNTEYSGLQVKGDANKVLRASVDNAGASAVGFDTTNGTLSNVISTNTRENSGVNFGHAGFPATGSVASNIIVDGAFGYGISVLSGTNDLSIDNFNVKNTGEMGISFSDGVLRGKLSNGVVAYPSNYSLGASGAQVTAFNIDSSARDAVVLLVDVTSGEFSENEVIESNGAAAQVRKAISNLTGSKQRLFFASNVPESYDIGGVVTGTSGATGIVSEVNIPVEYYEAAGGNIIRDARAYSTEASSQIRFADGSAIYSAGIPLVYTGSGSVQNFEHIFGSNAIWAGTPLCVVSIASYNNTSGFTLDYLAAQFVLGQDKVKIDLKASVNQTYGVVLMCQGRWK